MSPAGSATSWSWVQSGPVLVQIMAGYLSVTITSTNVGPLLIEPLGINFSKISIKIQEFPFKKITFKMSATKWSAFCLRFHALITSCEFSRQWLNKKWKQPSLLVFQRAFPCTVLINQPQWFSWNEDNTRFNRLEALNYHTAMKIWTIILINWLVIKKSNQQQTITWTNNSLQLRPRAIQHNRPKSQIPQCTCPKSNEIWRWHADIWSHPIHFPIHPPWSHKVTVMNPCRACAKVLDSLAKILAKLKNL